MHICTECDNIFNPDESKAINNFDFCSRQCEFHWECENEESES